MFPREFQSVTWTPEQVGTVENFDNSFLKNRFLMSASSFCIVAKVATYFDLPHLQLRNPKAIRNCNCNRNFIIEK